MKWMKGELVWCKRLDLNWKKVSEVKVKWNVIESCDLEMKWIWIEFRDEGMLGRRRRRREEKKRRRKGGKEMKEMGYLLEIVKWRRYELNWFGKKGRGKEGRRRESGEDSEKWGELKKK